MQPVNITLHQDIREKLKAGVDKLANAVKVTLGPRGKNVVLQMPFKNLHVTKDGVTVAKSIFLEDPEENMGAQMVKQAAEKTVFQAGDGTTTSTVLAQAILEEATKLIAAGASSIELKKGLLMAQENILSNLKHTSTPITTDDKETLKSIASISANNDLSLGDMIGDAFSEVGQDGVVAVQDSKSGLDSVEKKQGMEVARGFLSPYFVTNPEKMTAEFENALVYITDSKIKESDELVGILDYAAQKRMPIVIFADEIQGNALHLLILNRLQAGMPILAVKAPAFGDRRRKILEDMCVLTGAKLISESAGLTTKEANSTHLGRVKKVTSNQTHTTLIDGEGSQEDINQRLIEIKADIDQSANSFVAGMHKERYAKLKGGVVLLSIGGATELEQKQKKDRVDDAVNATRAALQEGIVAGGGIALLRASESVNPEVWKGVSEDVKLGMELLKKAVKYPFKVILANAGINEPIAFEKGVKASEDVNHGYNAATEQFVNMLDDGVIDPTKVVRVALENAVSVASLIMTTEAGIAPSEILFNTNKLPEHDQVGPPAGF